GAKGGAGFAVMTPLEEPSRRVIFVDRGFIPTGAPPPAAPEGRVRVEGLLRVAPETKPGRFTPDNRPAARDWYWIDLRALAAAQNLKDVAPFYLDLDATRPPLPNDHLQYAVTWFSLAAAALVIYVVFERSTAKGSDGRLSGA